MSLACSLLPTSEAGEELQLLTIHKAKGLEFDTVILPGLGRRTRPNDPRLLMWLEYVGDGQTRMLLAPIHEVGGEKDLLYEYLQKVDSEKRDYESTRLLYVAATRARKSLHLLGHTRLDRKGAAFKAPDSRSFLTKIWATVEPEFRDALKDQGIPEEIEDHTGTIEPKGVPLRRLATDWVPVPPPDDVVWKPKKQSSETEDSATRHPTFEWVSELQRRVGVVVHRMLQEMRVPDRLDFSEDILRVALQSEGLDGEKLDEAVSRAVLALRNTIRDDRGRWILSQHENDERESALSAVLDGRARRFVLDRTFVDGNTRWVIDYKTGTHTGSAPDKFLDNEQARYRAQLESYARVIQTIDSRPIRLGLYFPVFRGWREWSFEETSS